MLREKQVFHIRICWWHELSGTTVVMGRFIGKKHSLSRDLAELSFETKPIKKPPIPKRVNSFSTPAPFLSLAPRPWRPGMEPHPFSWRRSSIRSSPAVHFCQNNANVLEKHRNVNFVTCCIDGWNWGALSTKIWEKSTTRCHAGSYWPFAKFLWHPSSSFSADIMMWDTRGSPMQFFGLKRKGKWPRCDDFFGSFGG